MDDWDIPVVSGDGEVFSIKPYRGNFNEPFQWHETDSYVRFMPRYTIEFELPPYYPN